MRPIRLAPQLCNNLRPYALAIGGKPRRKSIG
jgi:hypothetical protein